VTGCDIVLAQTIERGKLSRKEVIRMSTYANIKIQGAQFHVTHDGTPINILEELKGYTQAARKMAKPGHIPEITVALVAADAGDHYSFFQHGIADPSFAKAYEIRIGPRGGLKIRGRN